MFIVSVSSSKYYSAENNSTCYSRLVRRHKAVVSSQCAGHIVTVYHRQYVLKGHTCLLIWILAIPILLPILYCSHIHHNSHSTICTTTGNPTITHLSTSYPPPGILLRGWCWHWCCPGCVAGSWFSQPWFPQSESV